MKMSSCLLPQFKSPPDLLLRINKSHYNSISMNLLTKCREPVSVQCTTLSEQAVTLAKAAADVARSAALMNGKYNPNNFLSDSDTIQLKRAQLIKTEHSNLLEHSIPSEIKSDTNHAVAIRSNVRGLKKCRKIKVTDTVISVTDSGNSNRRKRGSVPEVVYSDPLRYLRGTTGAFKLLTAKEEMILSDGIQEMLKLERIREELADCYGCPPSFRQWATAAGYDLKTLRSRVNYGIMCKDKMIKSNIRLVISIAKNYQGAGMNLQDLVQEGCRGLVRGTEKFDGTKGFKFSTYAHWWIKQAIKKALSDQSRTIRLPFHIVEATYRIKEAKRQFYSKNGRYPTDEEVALATGLSMKRLTAVLQAPKPPKSLDRKVGPNLDLKPSDIISDPEAETAYEVLTNELMKQDLDKILNTLTVREKQILNWRFGIPNGRMKTLQEIGELMGVSRERIRQIETCAFEKLKKKKKERSEILQQYFYSIIS